MTFLIALTEYLTQITYGSLFGSWLEGIQPFMVDKSMETGVGSWDAGSVATGT